MNYQNDPRWKYEIMTEPPYLNGSKQTTRDTIGFFGCYITSLGNIIKKTPHEINQAIIKNAGYFILHFREKCPIGRESFLVQEVFEKIYNCKIIDIDPKQADDQTIVRFKFWNYDHFSNIIKKISENEFEIFNVYTGKIEKKNTSQIDLYRKII